MYNQMSMTDLVFKFENYKLSVIKHDDDVWFKGKSVATILGYKNTKDSLIRHVDSDDKMKLGDLQPHEKLTSNQKNTIYINKSGLRSLICKSRMPNASKLAKHFNIDVHGHKYECKEAQSLGAIMKAFTGEKMNTQHPVLDYKIDLYFPDYNLAVECDENGHSDRSPAEERRRQRRITKKIKCQWLRFNPDSDDFNIFQVINQIFTVIKTKQHDSVETQQTKHTDTPFDYMRSKLRQIEELNYSDAVKNKLRKLLLFKMDQMTRNTEQ